MSRNACSYLCYVSICISFFISFFLFSFFSFFLSFFLSFLFLCLYLYWSTLHQNMWKGYLHNYFLCEKWQMLQMFATLNTSPAINRKRKQKHGSKNNFCISKNDAKLFAFFLNSHQLKKVFVFKVDLLGLYLLQHMFFI